MEPLGIEYLLYSLKSSHFFLLWPILEIHIEASHSSKWKCKALFVDTGCRHQYNSGVNKYPSAFMRLDQWVQYVCDE